MHKLPTTATTSIVRAFATRVGHEAVWVLIAGLFCVVEGAVKLTELAPAKLVRRRARVSVPFGVTPRHP